MVKEKFMFKKFGAQYFTPPLNKHLLVFIQVVLMWVKYVTWQQPKEVLKSGMIMCIDGNYDMRIWVGICNEMVQY